MAAGRRPVPVPTTAELTVRASETAASRGRRVAGRTVTAVGLALAAATLVLAWASPHVVLVVGDAALGRPALVGCALLAGTTVVAGHVAARRPGPVRAVEGAVVRGVVAGAVPVVLLGVPMVGFFAYLLLLGLSDALVAPASLLVVAGVLVGGAVLVRRGPPRTGAFLVGAGVAVLTFAALGRTVAVVDDDVVVARSPGGCTAVVRQTQQMFTGEAALYVAAPGSPLAQHRTSYRLEESFPFRGDDHVLDAGAHDVRIAFDDGRGGVDGVVPCSGR